MEVLDRILNAATELFRQYGFKTITMDDIARRAGISKKTLYQQFANKEEVVEAAMQYFHEHVFEACTGISHAADNAVAAMVQCMSLVDEMCGKMNPLAMLELQRFYPRVYSQLQSEMLAETIRLIRQNIEQGMAEGYYRQGLNADLLAHYRIATARMLNESETLMGRKFQLREINQALSEHFLFGLLTAKGERLYHTYQETYQQQASEL